MPELQNGELLKEMYDKVSSIHTDVAVIMERTENQGKTLDRHEDQIERLKYKVLPAVGIVTIIVIVLLELAKK